MLSLDNVFDEESFQGFQ
ncbi:hypothetical protein [Streptomyces sp. P9-1]